MITLILIKTPYCSRPIDYLIDTNKLENTRADKRLKSLIEKVSDEITLSSKNYWGRLTEKDNPFKNPILRNMTWFEECLYWGLISTYVELPATVEKIIYVNFEGGYVNTTQDYLDELNRLLTSDDYSNEFLQKAMDFLIDIEDFKVNPKFKENPNYNKVIFKASRLNRMLEKEWDTTSFQLYMNGVSHPGHDIDYDNKFRKLEELT